MTAEADDAAWAHLAANLTRIVAELEAGGARTETLATLVERRPLLGVSRRPIMRRVSRVWRLRELLLDERASVYRVGSVIRVAKQPDHYSEQSTLAAERRRVQLAAVRSGFELGETVNYDATSLELSDAKGRDAHPGIEVSDGEVVVHWGAVPGAASADGAASASPLVPYLDDAVALLTGR